MTDNPWDPEQYERFRDERSRPFYDLMALVRKRPGMRVADLGCGTGELTRVLHDYLQARQTIGVDNSPSMLARSSDFAGNGLSFRAGDIAEFAADSGYDLIFSNAALHWVMGHEELLRRLTAALADSGQLAVQVPANHDHPSHTAAMRVAGEQPFRDVLNGYVLRSGTLKPEEYATILHRLGYREQHVRLQVYGHALNSREEVIEWVKGTTLTAYQRRLSAELYARFLERYRELLLSELEDARPFFYTFKRILFWGQW
ncbi:MAG TPA: methyltransferase domain-containing protein [Blastocatellia bacterium]|nr:methyltransferase domain-containing protein [Blastocatellia bacterium]